MSNTEIHIMIKSGDPIWEALSENDEPFVTSFKQGKYFVEFGRTFEKYPEHAINALIEQNPKIDIMEIDKSMRTAFVAMLGEANIDEARHISENIAPIYQQIKHGNWPEQLEYEAQSNCRVAVQYARQSMTKLAPDTKLYKACELRMLTSNAIWKMLLTLLNIQRFSEKGSDEHSFGEMFAMTRNIMQDLAIVHADSNEESCASQYMLKMSQTFEGLLYLKIQ